MSKRAIYITGAVTMETAEMVTQQIENMASINSEDIFVFINSPGGSVPAMIEMQSAFLASGCDIVTIVYGRAMSAAAFLAVSGTKGKRFAFTNAQFMFHEPGGSTTLNDEGLEYLKRVEEYTTRTMAEITGMTVAEFSEFINRDKYIFADDLLDLGGFIDKVI